LAQLQKILDGMVTNSDLELTASIVQLNVAANLFEICEQMVASRSDNTPTLAWQSKGSTTTAPGYLL
jgi:hypothetical protein